MYYFIHVFIWEEQVNEQVLNSMPDIDLVDEKVFDLAMDNEMDTDLPIHQHPSNDQQIVSSQSSTPDQELADCTGQVLVILMTTKN